MLGVAINWGALLGWLAVHGSAEWAVLAPLYAGSILWTLHYDTVYAHQARRPPRAHTPRAHTSRMRSTALYLCSARSRQDPDIAARRT